MRDSTKLKHEIEALGVKVFRTMIDVYDNNSIRLTVPTNTRTLPGEKKRELARGHNGPIQSKTWIWFNRTEA